MKLKHYDDSVKINHNLNIPYISDHPCRIITIDGSGSSKTSVLLKVTKNQSPDIEKSYLHVIDPFESKYQLIINRREKVRIKELKSPKAFTDYSQIIILRNLFHL